LEWTLLAMKSSTLACLTSLVWKCKKSRSSPRIFSRANASSTSHQPTSTTPVHGPCWLTSLLRSLPTVDIQAEFDRGLFSPPFIIARQSNLTSNPLI
jgi:hypothetical protein